MLVDALSGAVDTNTMVSHHCAQAAGVGFENLSAADIPVIVKLVFCISAFVWNACGCSGSSCSPLAAGEQV